jgi:(1->4)-alpha-D-glucan 1-alpha-D-glucosylmutase
LLLNGPEGLSAANKAARRLFVMRFQQLTGPVMAKGVEDTAFYRHYPLASLNEVGGDLQVFGLDVNTFHEKIAGRAAHWPSSLLATSTHDAKRSEDVRARIDVLSEIPNEWADVLEFWSQQNARFKKQSGSEQFPDRAAEYLFYQTAVGTWPLNGFSDPVQHQAFVRRLQAYMEKATREAKLHTSWINPNEAYDSALSDFILAALTLSPDNEFLSSIEAFSRGISCAGLWNSLSQTVLKFICPGVPDVYQGCDLWNFALVDPDNRRPVDYGHRERLLSDLPLNGESRAAWLTDAIQTLADGRLKLYVTARLARFRRSSPDFFLQARYVPLRSGGPKQDNVVGFVRLHEDRAVIAATGRFFVELGCRTKTPTGDGVWQDTRLLLGEDLPAGTYRDLFSGGLVSSSLDGGHATLSVGEVFASLPIAVLVNDNAQT